MPATFINLTAEHFIDDRLITNEELDWNLHLMKSILPFPLHAPLYQPSDQYQVYTILERHWRSIEENKHPYFFLTGSAGTGKIFIILQIIELLKQRRQNYILMAQTGVATKNIGGK